MPRQTTPGQDLNRGIWRENPVLIQMLGLCPALAVSNTVVNSLAMGLATFFVLFCSSLLVATFKKLIPNEVRIATYILIIATFVTIVDMTLEAFTPEIHKDLGAFIALIVVNCMILGRQEAFASKNSVPRALLDATGVGIGFIIAMLMMGVVREVLGYGSLLGYSLFGSGYEPWVVFILPPGGFLTIGFILIWLNWWERRKSQRAEAAPDAVAVGRAA
jgi:electron transport complex protein RnfE